MEPSGKVQRVRTTRPSGCVAVEENATGFPTSARVGRFRTSAC